MNPQEMTIARRARPGEITVKEAALLLRVGELSTYRLYHGGKIRGRRASRFVIWIDEESVREYQVLKLRMLHEQVEDLKAQMRA